MSSVSRMSHAHLCRTNRCLGLAMLVVFLAQAAVSSPAQATDSATDAPAAGQMPTAAQGQSLGNLAEIQRQLENPLTSLWSLTLQENLRLNRGDLVDGTEVSNVLFFQPVMPVPIGQDWILITRPVFPLVTNLDPTLSGEDVAFKHTTGFGDIQLLTGFGPKRTDGVIYGGGATFKFPTATSDVLGQGKYQAGPAGFLAYLGKDWTLAGSLQHWWSYAGDGKRPATSQTDIGYAILRRLEHGWSVGMTPTISIDWKADSGDQLTLPVGLGLTKMSRWGRPSDSDSRCSTRSYVPSHWAPNGTFGYKSCPSSRAHFVDLGHASLEGTRSGFKARCTVVVKIMGASFNCRLDQSRVRSYGAKELT